MEWRDEGIILGSRRHGETSVILETMTRAHGRHLGLVRGGRSRKWQPVLQAGNRVDLVWRARLDEHLGAWQVEPVETNAARLFGSATAVFALQTFAAHLRLIPERDNHTGLYELLSVAVDHLDDPGLVGELVARFELRVLEELGFGLDLTRCVATGDRTDLAFVSPKSARAVSRVAGEPWADRLLVLPAFLLSAGGGRADADALDSALRLTGYFLARHVWEPRGMAPPDVRASLIAALRRPAARDSAA
jgi:DNA repair protein RecO (recombination protein O)